MSCHDPHISRVDFFRTKCLVCHSQVKYAAQHYPSNPDCTNCHMPRTGAQNIPHIAWTDHRIRQHPNQPDLAAVPTKTRELVPILTENSSPRDFALAYYNLVVVKGLTAERPRAWQMLLAAERSDPNDLAVLRALGITAELNRDDAHARNYYVAVLKKNPDNLAAGTNLGTLLANSGDLEAAATLWKQTFRQNADIPELGQNLARAQCTLGQKDAAE
ncbi:hypothetical protein RBB77_14075 [Tunturibacter psychrotolerans]|uniref:Tetratricopeptide repeat protein n=1 Tax=Tunturiibacter psychrotolerans TaxID=3069686 RepID=A0AAU7ZKI9_9BACT